MFLGSHHGEICKVFGVVLYALYLLMGSREVTQNEGRENGIQTQKGKVLITIYDTHLNH